MAQGFVVIIIPEVVCAHGDENPTSVVQLVLAIDVQNELARHVGELPDPFDLPLPGETRPLYGVVRNVHWDMEQAKRGGRRRVGHGADCTMCSRCERTDGRWQ